MAYFSHFRVVHGAQGSSEKLLIGIRNDDGSESEFKLQAQQVEGKTEAELLAAGNAWLTANGYPELVGQWGVHLRTDNNEPVLWANKDGIPPSEWPEDEIPPGS